MMVPRLMHPPKSLSRPKAAAHGSRGEDFAAERGYRVMKEVGTGAFGTVYSACDRSGRVVALKVIRNPDPSCLSEISILQAAACQSCIKYIDNFFAFDENTGQNLLVIVMEFLPTSLFALISKLKPENSTLPLSFIMLLSYQLFSGLYVLHSRNIAHLDIKPENILINPSTLEAKICDFGCAKVIKKSERYGTYVSSRYYRAPELLMDCEIYSFPVDIWAVGCVISDILRHGKPLFAGNSNFEVLEAISRVIGRPSAIDSANMHPRISVGHLSKRTSSLENELPPQTPPDLLDLLKSIFVYNPCQRITAMKCMQHRFYKPLLSSKCAFPFLMTIGS